MTAWYAGTSFLLVAAAGWVQYQTLARDLAREDNRLVLETLSALTRAGVGALRVDGPQDAALGPIVRVVDGKCAVVRGTWPEESPPPCAGGSTLSPAGPAPLGWQAPSGRSWRMATSDPDPNGLRVQVALDRWTDERVLRDYREKLSIVLLLTVLISAGLGLLFARRGLQPLVTLARRMRAIDAQSLDQRLAPISDAPTEVAEVVASFDSMLGRLEAAFAALSHFSAELAHEFRTPLHVLRQQSEVALAHARSAEEYRDVLGSGLEEIERLRRLVDDMLFLARAEDPRATIARSGLDAQRELRDVAEFLEPLALVAEVTLKVDVPVAVTVYADRPLLRRAVVNLVTNAIHHTPPAGSVTLGARVLVSGETVVTVVDTGDGIEPLEVNRIFDRFVRTPSSVARPEGAGLGLAIVRGIMALHRGAAQASSHVGVGTEVTLTFPGERG